MTANLVLRSVLFILMMLVVTGILVCGYMAAGLPFATWWRFAAWMPITPASLFDIAAMADAFNGETGFIRYTRDAAGRITGFDVSVSRMRGIRFEARP